MNDRGVVGKNIYDNRTCPVTASISIPEETSPRLISTS